MAAFQHAGAALMNSPPRRPAAMAYTMAVLRAAFEAGEDIDWLRRYAGRQYEFRLLAAAGLPVPELPVRGWHDLGRSLRIQVVQAAHELRISIQAEGFAALQRVANRAARLESPDGTIDVHFHFDSAGSGLAVLADAPATRQALARCYLSLDESPPGESV